MVVTFIGYFGGVLGALAARFVVFAPPYALVLLRTPYYRHYRRFASVLPIKAFVQGVTAGALGAIAGVAYILVRRSVTGIPTIPIAVVAFAVLSFRQVSSRCSSWRQQLPAC